MTDTDQLFDRVVKEGNRTPQEIREMIDKRKAATHGLLSDYGALYAVAKELGLEIGTEKITVTKLSLVRPKASVNVAGRVRNVTPVKEFQKKDGGAGRLSSILIADLSGELRLVLWDNNADIAGRISKGDVLLVKNGYGKSGLNNGVEVHAGSMSAVLVNPKITLDLPPLENVYSSIESLTKNKNSVDLVCRVYSYYPPTEFKRSDGSEGMRASFIGEDATGRIRVVLWGEAAKLPLTKGDYVKIENAYTREGMNAEIELQVGSRSIIKKTDETLGLEPFPEQRDLKIGEAAPDMSGFTTAGRVVRIYELKSYKNGTMASIVVGDSSGTVRVVLWNEKAEIVKELKRGDAVKIRNAYAKAGQSGEVEIHVGRYGEIIVSQDLEIEPLKEIEEALVTEKKIIDLSNNDRYVRIGGKVADIDEARKIVYMTCSACGKRVQNMGDVWFCESCSEEVEPASNLRVSVTVEDDTGSIKAVAFRENAEKILGMDLEEVMNIIGETQDELEPVRQVKDLLLAKSVTLLGRVRYSEFTDQLEFMVEEVE